MSDKPEQRRSGRKKAQEMNDGVQPPVAAEPFPDALFSCSMCDKPFYTLERCQHHENNAHTQPFPKIVTSTEKKIIGRATEVTQSTEKKIRCQEDIQLPAKLKKATRDLFSPTKTSANVQPRKNSSASPVFKDNPQSPR